MEIAIETLVAICFLVVGLSHILQPRLWVEFFVRLRDKGALGSLQLGMFHLPLALLIVGFHQVWHGLPLIVTIIGWGQLLKSTLYLLWPKHGLRMLARVRADKSWHFVMAGIFSILFSAVVFFSIGQRDAITP